MKNLLIQFLLEKQSYGYAEQSCGFAEQSCGFAEQSCGFAEQSSDLYTRTRNFLYLH